MWKVMLIVLLRDGSIERMSIWDKTPIYSTKMTCTAGLALFKFKLYDIDRINEIYKGRIKEVVNTSMKCIDITE